SCKVSSSRNRKPCWIRRISSVGCFALALTVFFSNVAVFINWSLIQLTQLNRSLEQVKRYLDRKLKSVTRAIEMSRTISELIFARRRKQFLSADLVENRAELVKVYRLDQMKIEARFFAAPNVFVRAKPGDGHRFNRLFAFGLGNHLVATAIGKANVAQHDVELLRLDDLQSALCVIGD